MDFQGFINTFAVPCAVLSVQKLPDGRCGEIRIVKANDFYKEKMGVVRYHDLMIYSELVPRDSKFEDFCYRAAVLKERLHAYVETKGLNGWTDANFVPLNCEENDLSYCAFFFEFTRNAEPERMSVVSPETASDVIRNCISLRSSKDFDSGIMTVVEDIQRKTKSLCTCILIPDKENKKYSVLAEKFFNDSPGVLDYELTKKYLPYSIVETWENTIGQSNGIIVKDESDLQRLEEKNPIWGKNIRWAEIKSLILYPLLQNRKIIGYLFCTNFDVENLVDIKQYIELTTFFLASEISSHMALEKLEHYSLVDLLTGVKNRSAMNWRVDSFVKGEKTIPHPFGIIFARVNGLKKINDESGHDYGDILLKKTAILLAENFPDGEIYRASGDEFMVILPACQQNDFKRKVERLKQVASKESEIYLTVGADWNEEGKKLRRSMHFAAMQIES